MSAIVSVKWGVDCFK